MVKYVGSVAPKRWNHVVDPILRPVVDLVESGIDYPELMGKLADMFPDMDSTELEEMLARCWFIADASGRVAVKQEARPSEASFAEQISSLGEILKTALSGLPRPVVGVPAQPPGGTT